MKNLLSFLLVVSAAIPSLTLYLAMSNNDIKLYAITLLGVLIHFTNLGIILVQLSNNNKK
jgi:hypothetical protein